MRLYSYFRSSTSYRVRIALNLKGLAYHTIPVDLLASEQTGVAHTDLNPFAAVPVLDTPEINPLAQSMAILEWLEDTYPTPPIWPETADERATARSLAYAIASDLHPLNNLRVLTYLKAELDVDKAGISDWYKHWVAQTFESLEAALRAMQPQTDLPFGKPTGFEACLIPQMYNARRFECDLSDYPILCGIDAACTKLRAFEQAAPDQQPDHRL